MATLKLPVTGRIGGALWRLVDGTTGQSVMVGERRTSGNGATARVSGGTPPHKPSSTGYIWVRIGGATMDAQYYASVYGARWVREEA